jgi:acyl transferase domain-containing protein
MPSDRLASSPDLVAVVGLGCRLPGGAVDRPTALALFRSGADAVGPIPADRWDPDALGPTPSGREGPRTGGFLAEVDRFDPALFGIAPREARAMDPQQRLLLEVAYDALEDANLAPDSLAGARAGVYVGMGLTDWARRTFGQDDPARLDPWSGTGVFDSVAAGRIAYTFGLEGPALAVHTACSSSLVALHLAVRALRAGECDLALAGGVNLLLTPEPGLYFAEIGALSPTGRCRTFDAAADGYVRGEGCGLLVVKRLADALRDGDPVLAVVAGTAVNQDGRTTALTAPSGRAQAAVIRAALDDAGLTPADVGYLEAHGTGTPLGDPIEVGALAEVFGGGDDPLWVGSAKTQVGHLEAAAGVAGVIRAIGALRDGVVPPHLHFSELNPRIRLAGSRIRIAGPSATAWGREVRVAGVSSFGLSGTNAHVVLQAPPARESASDGPRLVAVSGHTADVAVARVAQVRDALAAGVPAPAVARAATDGRSVHRFRAAFVVDGPVPADVPVREVAGEPELVFAFTGQGAQWPGMGRRLYETEPAYRGALDRVGEAYRARTGRDLVATIHRGDGAVLADTRWTQPALFASSRTRSSATRSATSSGRWSRARRPSSRASRWSRRGRTSSRTCRPAGRWSRSAARPTRSRPRWSTASGSPPTTRRTRP